MSESQYDPNHPIVKETIECLVKTFTEKDNKERSSAENTLKSMEDNILSHLKNILSGFAQLDSFQSEVKLSIILYLKNILKVKLTQKSFVNEEVVSITQSFLDLMLYSDLSDILLQNLSLCLTNIFNSFYFTNDATLILQVIKYFREYAEKLIAEQNPIVKLNRFKPLIYLLQISVSSLSTNKDNIYDVIRGETEIVEYMIEVIRLCLSNKENYSAYNTGLETSRYVLDFLFLCVLKLKKMNILETCYEDFVIKFVPFATDIILMDKSLVSFTGNNEYDSIINSTKSKSFQFISYILQNEPATITNALFMKYLTQIVSPVVNFLPVFVSEKLDYISNMKSGSSEFPDNNIDSLLYQMLLFLSRVLIREPVLTQFGPLCKNFILCVLFPFLISTKQEYIKMKIEGEEYHHFINDLTRHHKFKTYKTSTAFLLTKLCDKFDGIANFVAMFALQLLDYSLKGSDIKNISQYSLLNVSDHKNQTASDYTQGVQKILSSFSPEIHIDTSLLIILILEGFIGKNASNLAVLRIILETHMDSLISVNSDMIKDKLCLIYGTYLDDLYQSDEIETFYQHISKVMEFLFYQILIYQENQGVAYQASHALNQLIYYKDFSDVVNNIVNKILPKLIEMIKECDVVLFFDVIVDIVVYLEIHDNILHLSKAIVGRVLREYKTPSLKSGNNKDEGNIIMAKCFHILRSIIEKNDINIGDNSVSDVEVVVHSSSMIDINHFEAVIEPIVMYLKNPQKIEFDDELIYLLITLLKAVKCHTPLTQSVFPYLILYMAKNNGMTEELFEYLNLFVVYDKHNFLSSNEEMTERLFAIVKQAIQETDHHENSLIYGSLLLEAFVQFNKNISETLINEMFVFIFTNMNDLFAQHEDEDVEDFIKSVDINYLTVLISALYSFFINYQYTILKVYQNNMVNQLFKWTETAFMLTYSSSIQNKSIILGICSILSHPEISKIFTPFKKAVLMILFSLLSKQKNEETKSLKTVMKNETECHFVDSDEEEFSDDEGETDDHKIMEYKKVSKKIQSLNRQVEDDMHEEERELLSKISNAELPIKTVDEYSIFSQTMQSLYHRDQQYFDDWMNTMKENEKLVWRELIHTKRIQVDYSGKKIDVPRRTVKIKREERL